MNNISIANETLKIIKNGGYDLNGKEVKFPEGSYSAVWVYSPERLASVTLPDLEKEELCRFEVINADSFEAAKKYEYPLVMNFANSHVPGGGFKLGATAQEEALCRNSTLYASIGGEAAKEMYSYNIKHFSPVDSDYLLISPEVWVFRAPNGEKLETPYKTAVITTPAPNKRGAAAFTSQAKIDDVMLHRTRLMLKAAAENKFKTLVLGAWGCGAFGHDPIKVSGYFKQVLVDEGFGTYFDTVCFAIYGKTDGKNYTAFNNIFGKEQ